MKEIRKSGSINWFAVKGEGFPADEFNDFLKKEALTIKPIDDNYVAPTRFCDYDTDKGRVGYLRNGDNTITLYWLQREAIYRGKRCFGYSYEPKKYTIKLNHDDASEATGKEAFDYINQEFQRLYGTSIRVAFGYSPECLPCIPEPLNYGKISPDDYLGFYKIDASSAYATEACKDLPTMKGSKTVVGLVLPSKDYPFAFYPKEGKLAIYGESKYLNDVPLDPAYTLLCKKCEFSLRPILEKLYEAKEAEKDPKKRQYYKDILNYFVGWLHWRPKNKITGKYAQPGDPEYNPNCPRYAIQAAIVKARCNARMLDLQDQIEAFGGNQVVLINTDAVGWTGHDMPHLYTTEKGLGNLIIEHKNAKIKIRGSKKYQILDRDGTLTTKWAGVRKELTSKMKWGDIDKKVHQPKQRIWSWEKQQLVYKEEF